MGDTELHISLSLSLSLSYTHTCECGVCVCVCFILTYNQARRPATTWPQSTHQSEPTAIICVCLCVCCSNEMYCWCVYVGVLKEGAVMSCIVTICYYRLLACLHACVCVRGVRRHTHFLLDQLTSVQLDCFANQTANISLSFLLPNQFSC